MPPTFMPAPSIFGEHHAEAIRLLLEMKAIIAPMIAKDQSSSSVSSTSFHQDTQSPAEGPPEDTEHAQKQFPPPPRSYAQLLADLNIRAAQETYLTSSTSTPPIDSAASTTPLTPFIPTRSSSPLPTSAVPPSTSSSTSGTVSTLPSSTPARISTVGAVTSSAHSSGCNAAREQVRQAHSGRDGHMASAFIALKRIGAAWMCARSSILRAACDMDLGDTNRPSTRSTLPPSTATAPFPLCEGSQLTSSRPPLPAHPSSVTTSVLTSVSPLCPPLPSEEKFPPQMVPSSTSPSAPISDLPSTSASSRPESTSVLRSVPHSSIPLLSASQDFLSSASSASSITSPSTSALQLAPISAYTSSSPSATQPPATSAPTS
ncbi:hypothetical protein A4X13_0g9303, partial [Tilletia indica]